MGNHKKFTTEEIEFINASWGKLTINKIRLSLNCSWTAIENFGRQSNLGESYDYKWSDLEKSILSYLWGYKSIEYISKKLNISEKAISEMAYKLKLGAMKSANLSVISLTDLSEIINISTNVIKNNWSKKGLRIIKQKQSKRQFYYAVKRDDLIKFLKENQNLWDSKNVDYGILGNEKEWIAAKRNSDLEKTYNKYTYWTTKEELKAKKLRLENYSYEEIARILNKSSDSVKAKLCSLQVIKEHQSKYISLTSLMKEMKVTKHAILNHWTKYGLSIITEDKNQVQYFLIEIKHLINFLLENQNLWNAKYVSDDFLGIEDSWFKEKKKIDTKLNLKQVKATDESLVTDKVVELYNLGYSFGEIANKLNIKIEKVYKKIAYAKKNGRIKEKKEDLKKLIR